MTLEEIVVEHLRQMQALQLREQAAKAEKAESELRVQQMTEKHVLDAVRKLELPKIPVGGSS